MSLKPLKWARSMGLEIEFAAYRTVIITEGLKILEVNWNENKWYVRHGNRVTVFDDDELIDYLSKCFNIKENDNA